MRNALASLGVSASAVLLFLLSMQLVACGGPPGPAEYPETKLASKSVSMAITDSRQDTFKEISEAPVMNRDESDTYPQPLPDNFETQAKARLQKLTGTSGPKVVVHAEVRRCDVTFYNDKFRGDFVKYDVVLGFKVTTEGGALLDKGSGGLWQELPREEASEQAMRRAYVETAMGAFDKYFASEDTLETINENLERYLATHPNER